MGGSKQPESHERSVPVKFQGKLESNYYCRAWNEKRQKYCKSRAGAKTDHVGSGRCSQHGGNAPIKHGRYSVIQRERIKDLYTHMLESENPLELLDDLALARAAMIDFVERYDQNKTALLAWHGSFKREFAEDFRVWRMKWEKFYSDYRELWIQAFEQPDEFHDLPAPKDLMFPPMPDPLSYLERPQTVLDVGDIRRHVETISNVVYKIERIRKEGTITLETLDRVLEQMGVELVQASQATIKNETERSNLLQEVESRWASVALEPKPSSPRSQQRAQSLN